MSDSTPVDPKDPWRRYVDVTTAALKRWKAALAERVPELLAEDPRTDLSKDAYLKRHRDVYREAVLGVWEALYPGGVMPGGVTVPNEVQRLIDEQKAINP